MSRKHNVPKQGRSNYKQRLADRGLGKPPRMAAVESLRARQPSISDLKAGNDRGYWGLSYQKSEIRMVRGNGSGQDEYNRRHR